MSGPRFFTDPDNIQRPENDGGVVQANIEGDEAQHAARVLRLTPGERVVVCDGSGMEYLGVLRTVSPAWCEVEVREERFGPGEPTVEVHLFAGLSKGDKMDFLVQKCTELGLNALHPVMTERSVVRLQGEKALARSKRWEKIAKEAAKQCGRSRWPRVSPPLPLAKALTMFACDSFVVAWEEGTTSWPHWRQQLLDSHRMGSVGAVIGPEGGLSAAEVAALKEQGAIVGSLGRRILRTETAGMILLAFILDTFDDFAGVAKHR